MRDLFPGYYRPTDDEFEELWRKSTFIFDANVLLNMYSYPEAAREIFFSVLEKVIDRTWVPYQVALEFHKNRSNRIKQSNKKIEQLLDLVRKTGEDLEKELKSIEFEKRNTGITDIEIRMGAVRDSHKSLAEAIKEACNRLPVVRLDEQIGLRIATLFDGKVGAPPESQEKLNELFSDGADRYEKKIPPGFEDIKKMNEYRDRGLVYPAKFGDLIMWRQLIDHAKNNNVENIIFVTGDMKKDWWLEDEGKTIGPLPDLIQEIFEVSDIKGFWIYSNDQFLENAEKYLNASEVTKETIAQVKETSDLVNQWEILVDAMRIKIQSDNEKPQAETHFMARRSFGGENERERLEGDEQEPDEVSDFYFTRAAKNWISEKFDNCEIITSDYFPRFHVVSKNINVAYEVVRIDSLGESNFPSIVRAIRGGRVALENKRFDYFSMLIVMDHDLYLSVSGDDLIKFTKRVEDSVRSSVVNSVEIGYFNGFSIESIF